jgi:hypothetical protein
VVQVDTDLPNWADGLQAKLGEIAALMPKLTDADMLAPKLGSGLF